MCHCYCNTPLLDKTRDPRHHFCLSHNGCGGVRHKSLILGLWSFEKVIVAQLWDLVLSLCVCVFCMCGFWMVMWHFDGFGCCYGEHTSLVLVLMDLPTCFSLWCISHELEAFDVCVCVTNVSSFQPILTAVMVEWFVRYRVFLSFSSLSSTVDLHHTLHHLMCQHSLMERPRMNE